ncbi:LAMI_0B01200g1_1 [Lachancea mirantina]|uniref:LAMI_0B01200g1_1 n=1 Tax=Lachancea mirantina TaxID=1230905 RepID=A0A1G4ITA2_9SACH|nr:LAMI_0B01200g1_1 [Lachancea mirantina]
MVQILVQSDLCSVVKEISMDTIWVQLSEKLYELSGVRPEDMRLTIWCSNGLKHEINNETVRRADQCMKDVLEQPAERITVVDTNQNSIAQQLTAGLNAIDGSSDGGASVGTYQLPEDEYVRRQDSVYAWKKQNQLGRFSSQYSDKVKKARDAQVAHATTLCLDERCSVTYANAPERRGWLRYVGKVPEINDIDCWCGVELDEPLGRNDGTFDGHTYFGPVRKNYGAFVKPLSVRTCSSFVPAVDDELCASDSEI